MFKKVMGLIFCLALFLCIVPNSLSYAAEKTYSISPKTKPVKKAMKKYHSYNKHTKHYYVFRSYLEKLEKEGGGKLVIKKGTYTISNALYVPSNVKIYLKNGTKLVKGSKTGTKTFKASKSMFQFVRPSRAHKKGVYGRYNGEKNISIIGEGKATIDLKYIPDSFAIMAGHNKNVKIENIRFQNMRSGHFIEMDATEKAIIRKNKFINAKPSIKRNKEAINLDTPDKATKGWSQKWSKFDKTPNRNILIEKNTFQNLERAIGTHKYSQGDDFKQKYHEKVVIRNNHIENSVLDPIRVMNWSNTIIEKNTIKNVSNGEGDYRAILVSGAINPTIQNNTIINVARPIQFFPWKNSGPGSKYNITYNELTEKNLSALLTNKIINTQENWVRVNHSYNEFAKNTIKINIY